MNIKLQEGATVPTRGSKHAAGYDLFAMGGAIIPAGTRKKLMIGVHIQMPSDIVGNICHRSGMHAKAGILVSGKVDPDYTGELGVTLFNLDPNKPYVVEAGDRIAQIIFNTFSAPELNVVDELKLTDRGDNGYGSTGI